MSKLNIAIAIIFIISGLFFFVHEKTYAQGAKSLCISDPIELGVDKKLLPLRDECPAPVAGQYGVIYCGRGERPGIPGCFVPKEIIMHTTHGHLKAIETFNYFASGARGDHCPTGWCSTGSHFVVGDDGEILQMIEMGKTEVEFGQAVGGLTGHISIEMGAPGNYANKAAAPAAQYEQTLKLVKTLMNTYNIPKSRVVGHYVYFPPPRGAGDPGEGWMTDFLKDLDSATPLDGSQRPSTNTGSGGGKSNCVVTEVGDAPGEPVLPASCSEGGPGPGGGGPAGPCQAAPAPPGDIKTAIKDKWGATVNIPDSQLQMIWEAFHEIDCTGILQDLNGLLIDSWGEIYAQQFSCPGKPGEKGDTDIMFSTQFSGESGKALLTHELTHVWQFCSSRGEANLMDIQEAYRGEGGLTVYSRQECTNPLFRPGADRIYHEDHADTIALYLYSGQNELTCSDAPNPFSNGGKPLHRTAAEKGVGKK